MVHVGLFCDRSYNGGRNRKEPVSREVAMEELLQVVKAFQISLQIKCLVKIWTRWANPSTKTSFFADKINKAGQVHTADYGEERWLCESGIPILNPRGKVKWLVWAMWSINMVLVLFYIYGISRIRAVCWWCWVLVSTGQRLDSGVPICIPVRKLWFWHKQEENQGEHCNQPHNSVLLSVH